MAVYLVSYDLRTTTTNQREDDYKKIEKVVTELSGGQAVRVLKSQFVMTSKLPVAELTSQLDSRGPFGLGDGLLVVEVHSDTMASNLPTNEQARLLRFF